MEPSKIQNWNLIKMNQSKSLPVTLLLRAWEYEKYRALTSIQVLFKLPTEVSREADNFKKSISIKSDVKALAQLDQYLDQYTH